MRFAPLLLVAALLTGCGGGGNSASTDTTAAPAVIQIDGSSTVFPISEAVAEEFQKANKSIRVTVGISGTGGGFQKFCRGETDISDASRPISATEIEACKKAGIDHRAADCLRRTGRGREPEEYLPRTSPSPN
jgi:phosphate transport system substrate-binding protein